MVKNKVSKERSSKERNEKSNYQANLSKSKRKFQQISEPPAKFVKVEDPKITSSKKIWNELREFKGDKNKLIQQLKELLDGHYKEFAIKHDTSRIIQSLIKYSSPADRLFILSQLKGSIVELCKSTYGKFLIVKLLHYGTNEARQQIIEEIRGNVRTLLTHKEAAYVLEDAFREYSNLNQKLLMAQELYSPEFSIFKETEKVLSLRELIEKYPEKQQIMLRNLLECLKSSIRKGSIGFSFIHYALLQCMENGNKSQKEECIDLIKEQIAEVVHTKDGSEAAMHAFAMGTAKDRKFFLRSLKSFFKQALEDEYGHLVIIAALQTVDDTTLVSKILKSNLSSDLVNIIKHKYARRPILYQLTNGKRYFIKNVQEKFAFLNKLKQDTSRKDDGIRRKELLDFLVPMILDCITKNAYTLLSNPMSSSVVVETLLCTAGNYFKEEALDAICKCLASDPAEETHLIHFENVPRILRTLIQNGHWNRTKNSVDIISEQLMFAERLKENVRQFIKGWICGPGVFVVASLLANLKDKEEFIHELGHHVSYLKDADRKGVKGVSLLIAEIEN